MSKPRRVMGVAHGPEDIPLVTFTSKQLLEEVLHRTFPHSLWDDSQERTAERLLAYLAEYTPRQDLGFNFTTFDTEVNQLVVVQNIEFASICKHHLLPFFGACSLGYIPNALMAGASKFPRLVDFWAKRPQTQEYLTEIIAHDLKDRLKCQGVAVVMSAAHTCISCRGVRKVGAKMNTSCMTGVFLTNPAARQEFFDVLRLGE